MKIKVTYEKIYDSNIIYDKDDVPTQDEFECFISNQIIDEIDLTDTNWKFEKLENDSE